jgi:hypothetical protein
MDLKSTTSADRKRLKVRQWKQCKPNGNLWHWKGPDLETGREIKGKESKEKI